MNENKINLSEFNMTDEELFAPVAQDELASERITAPRYSYWRSVFRVFFRKKINIIALSLLAVLIIFSYVYPAVIGYDATVDPYINVLDGSATHLKPAQAFEKFGPALKWILGSGGAGECELPHPGILCAKGKSEKYQGLVGSGTGGYRIAQPSRWFFCPHSDGHSAEATGNPDGKSQGL